MIVLIIVDIMWSRKHHHTIKVVVITSLCWCVFDVWLLSSFSGCANSGLTTGISLREKVDNDIADESIEKIGKVFKEDEQVVGADESAEDEKDLVAPPKIKKSDGFFDKIIPDGN